MKSSNMLFNGSLNGYHTHQNGKNGVSDQQDTDQASLIGHDQRETGQQAPAESYDPEFELLVEQMLRRLGENPDRDGLLRTPLRVAKAMDELTSGYSTSLESIVNNAIFEDDGKEMVIVKDIEFYSLCEHHMLPFFGKVHIGYIPNGKIIGLSKLARITDIFARRLQVQERLTNQIADALVEVLEPRGVAIVAEASHFCMMMRGVQKQNSTTLTSAMRGVFNDNAAKREEFLQMLRGF
jgi:GTP cyclohydrolase IA